jgi:DNA repair protein RadC
MKTLKSMQTIDQPREKLMNKGIHALKDHELMAIVLGTGTKNKDVLVLSKEIMKLFNEGIDTITLEKLLNIHGLGQIKASKILSAIELSKRHLIQDQSPKISCAQEVYDILSSYKNKKQEYFLSLYLDGANHLIEKRVISIGTLNNSLVHPREVFAPAIELRAASIIVAHNHPSGQLLASKEDQLVTKRLFESANLLGIEFIDHIIICKNGFKSIL